MTDPEVAALIVSDLSDTEGLQSELHAAYRALMVVVSERDLALDALEVARRRVAELETEVERLKGILITRASEASGERDEWLGWHDVPHDAEGDKP